MVLGDGRFLMSEISLHTKGGGRPESLTTRTFSQPLFLITYPYIAHCMGSCRAKGEWSLFSISLSLSLSSLSPLYTVLPIAHRARLFPRRRGTPTAGGGASNAVERIWHIYHSQGQILALAFRGKLLKHFKLFHLGSDAECQPACPAYSCRKTVSI